MLNPIICLIKNTTAKTWHTIVFVESPLPGSAETLETVPIRHKSKMHHTTGFGSRDEAIESIPDLQARLETVAIGPIETKLERDFEWDGDGPPAMVIFFDN